MPKNIEIPAKSSFCVMWSLNRMYWGKL